MALFGTDGIRGIANEELTPELAFHVGKAGGVFLRRTASGERPRVVVGRDTRLSGPMLAGALGAGLMSAGCTVLDLGIAPTPAIAWLTRDSESIGGVVVSASHNPWQYNGIKFFSTAGAKLSPGDENEIELLIDQSRRGQLKGVAPARVGVLVEAGELLDHYRDGLVELMRSELGDQRPFAGLTVGLDCANGAAVTTARAVFEALGAGVRSLGMGPDGTNINENVGSLHPESVRGLVEGGARLGFAFDGDADRVIAVAEDGSIIDGDQVILACARELKSRDELSGHIVVITVMSNMALDLLLGQDGIAVSRTPVGDREVYVRMCDVGAALGGEQSGHIIFRQHNQTGDGLLTALQVTAAVVRSGRPLSELVSDFHPLPQKLVNVRVDNKERAMQAAPVKEAVAAVEATLEGRGRVLVRPSGTEPVIRVMVEGPEEAQLDELADRVVSAVKSIT